MVEGIEAERPTTERTGLRKECAIPVSKLYLCRWQKRGGRRRVLEASIHHPIFFLWLASYSESSLSLESRASYDMLMETRIDSLSAVQLYVAEIGLHLKCFLRCSMLEGSQIRPCSILHISTLSCCVAQNEWPQCSVPESWGSVAETPECRIQFSQSEPSSMIFVICPRLRIE